MCFVFITLVVCPVYAYYDETQGDANKEYN